MSSSMQKIPLLVLSGSLHFPLSLAELLVWLVRCHLRPVGQRCGDSSLVSNLGLSRSVVLGVRDHLAYEVRWLGKALVHPSL